MDSDCHKQKPPEETWHPSRRNSVSRRRENSPKRNLNHCKRRDGGENRGAIMAVGKENSFWRGAGLPGAVTQIALGKSGPRRGPGSRGVGGSSCDRSAGRKHNHQHSAGNHLWRPRPQRGERRARLCTWLKQCVRCKASHSVTCGTNVAQSEDINLWRVYYL